MEIQGHSQLHSELQASLEYMRAFLKAKSQSWGVELSMTVCACSPASWGAMIERSLELRCLGLTNILNMKLPYGMAPKP